MFTKQVLNLKLLYFYPALSIFKSLCAMQMKLLETKIKPLSYVDKLGEPEKIYSTTFGATLFPIFLFGIVFLIAAIPLVERIYQGTLEMDDSLYKLFAIIFILSTSAVYLFIGNSYRYVALFKNGIVLKKRFKTYILKYKDIKKVELRSWGESIDIILKDDKFVSMGDTERLIKMFPYPRLFKGVRIVGIEELLKNINLKLNAHAHNNELW